MPFASVVSLTTRTGPLFLAFTAPVVDVASVVCSDICVMFISSLSSFSCGLGYRRQVHENTNSITHQFQISFFLICTFPSWTLALFLPPQVWCLDLSRGRAHCSRKALKLLQGDV